jgi:retron-type reverse transcriptase
LAWSEFKKDGKLKKSDVGIFAAELEENIFALNEELALEKYRHGGYKKFAIYDPKRRIIHKASVRNRLLHRAIFRILYPLFDKIFIFDSYSSRVGKGIHKAKKRFEQFALKISKNNSRTIYILKCDVRKFFDNIGHKILFKFLSDKIKDKKVLRLLLNIISSFETESEKGIPLGNLTSQLFSNIYLNCFDQFVKRELRIKFYIRYADDFAIFSEEKEILENLAVTIENFLEKKLALAIHPDKISIRKWFQGIDFLGFVHYPNYSILRIKTRKRIFRKVLEKKTDIVDKKLFRQTIQSYKGIMNHCRGFHTKRKIKKLVGLEYYKSK